MNYATIANVLGKLLIVTGISMVFPLICSLYYGEDDLYALVVSAIVTIGLGVPLWRFFRRYQDLNIKDGFFIAFFGWVLISALSGLPYMIHGSIPSFTAARVAVLAQPDPSAGRHGLFNPDRYIPASWNGGIAPVPGRIESRSGDYQRKIYPPQS
jgi:Trk-type K+ transport system membrane component